MKKQILFACVLCVLISALCGCAKKDENASAAAKPSTGEAQQTGAGSPDGETASPETPDPEARAFVSVPSLLAGVRQARETDTEERTAAQAVLADMEEVFAPEAEFEGYTLLGVEASEGYLIYYYMPDEGTAFDGFDYRQGISVTVCTDPGVTLAQVCAELGLEMGTDGFAFDAEHNQLFFAQDGHTCSLQMPESAADPEAMKPFCRIRRFPVN